jgi:pantoate--beta-alanine ligase
VIVARTVAEARAALRELPRPLGFTPTMGALHEGHLSLVGAARARCAAVAASIFVNPTQFGRGEDLDKYPRDEGRDLGLFEQRGVDVVFAPSADVMYPEGFATQVHVGGPLSEQFEGASRPSHFDGVAVIVAKLLGVVQPDVLFLGQKDAQQLAVVRRLVRDLDLPVEVAAVPTVREHDGLALSSRNAYLMPEHRAAAPDLYGALLVGAAAAESGEPADDVVAVTAMALRVNPEGHTPLSVEYVAVVDADTFQQQHQVIGPRGLLVAAASLGSTRLIDNIPLTPSAYPAEDATT